MGKPSVTNIQPPLTPPITTWDLDNPTSVAAAGSKFLHYGASGFDAKLSLINTAEPSARPDMVLSGSSTYDYVFFGVNGGSDETVKGVTGAAGVLVTGNGKDNITGGDQDDLVWAGNGKDTVHGGGGDDIIYGENGPDTLYGDADHGSAQLVGASHQVLTLNGDAAVWASDPNNTHVAVAVPGKTTVSKEGVFVALDANNHPTELDAQGHPIIHVVYSITPETTGSYTLTYTHGNGLDGPGNPSFPVNTDEETVTLTAGQKYFFSLTYDPGHSTVKVEVGDGQDNSVPTSQAIPDTNWADLFHTETVTGTELHFVAGDQLIGGAGPDKFVYDRADGNSVDLIWDYNQGAGFTDPLEGDTLVLKNASAADLSAATLYQNVDLDGAGHTGLVIRFDANHAIGLVGVSSLADVTVVFG